MIMVYGSAGKDEFDPQQTHAKRSNVMDMDQQNNASNISDLEIAQALTAMIYASTWEKTCRILEERQNILLKDRALELLNIMVIGSYMRGDISDAKNLAQYEELLARARVYGVAVAWQNFSPLEG